MKMHLSLRVADLHRSLRFYTAFFGEAAHKVRPGYANFDLSDPPLKFALTEDAMIAKKGSLDHLGFQVSNMSELEAFKSRLQAAGLATFDETDTICCYAKQDKIWAHDPDGNEWEIYLLTDDLQKDHAHDHSGNLLESHAGATTSTLVIQPAHRCCVSNEM